MAGAFFSVIHFPLLAAGDRIHSDFYNNPESTFSSPESNQTSPKLQTTPLRRKIATFGINQDSFPVD